MILFDHFVGDVAIDDIKLSEKPCTYSMLGVCDFEDPNICGFGVLNDSPEFKFEQHQGSDLNYQTFYPQFDHTDNSPVGKFISASSGKLNGSKTQ